MYHLNAKTIFNTFNTYNSIENRPFNFNCTSAHKFYKQEDKNMYDHLKNVYKLSFEESFIEDCSSNFKKENNDLITEYIKEQKSQKYTI